MKRLRIYKQFFRRFAFDQQGSVVIISGLMLLTLLGVTGAGIDLAAQSLVQRKLQQSSDLAAVAAGASRLYLNTTNAEQAQIARRYFNLNYPENYNNTPRPTPNVAVTNNGIEISARNVSVPTAFAQFIGVNTLEANGRTVIGAGSETSGNVYDMILILDNSGSMASLDASTGTSRTTAMVRAAGQLTENLMGNGNPSDNRMAIVPYDHAVPSGPNTNCSATNNNFASSVPNPAVAFSNSKSTVDNAVRASGAYGGTNSGAGFRFARDNAGFVPAMRTSVSNGSIIRAVVWITDGVNFCFQPHPEWNTQTLDVCRQFKNDGIVIFTIAFGPDVSNDPTVRNLMSDCASGANGVDKDQFFFVAPDGVTLNTAFDSILTTVNSLRISE